MAKRKSSKNTSKRPVSGITPKQGSVVSRYISFAMLIVSILVFCFFFYNVIKGFLLPLFLAVLMAVIFRPYHQWVNARLGKRPRLAAAFSTASIMLIVLVPLTGLVMLGVHEANDVLRSYPKYLEKAQDLTRSVGLKKPFASHLDIIEAEMRELDDALRNFTREDATHFEREITQAKDVIIEEIEELRQAGRDAAWDLHSDLLQKYEAASTVTADTDLKAAKEACGEKDGLLLVEAIELKGPLNENYQRQDRGPEKLALRYVLQRGSTDSEFGFLELIDAFAERLSSADVKDGQRTMTYRERTQALTDLQFAYDRLQTALLGGPIRKWGIEFVNPSNDKIKDWATRVGGSATRWLPSITNTATSLIGGLVMGLAIMAIAMFYFFLDGAKMVNSFMHLSPLDDRHELELLQEFDKVGRAVVLATLLSAVAQGILGGIGYKLVGLHSVFLLTLLTAVLALIPFVGAAAIWVPACLYIAFIKEPIDPEAGRTWLYAKAGFLAVYGALVISMADNVIKPWVLQGQSKLHPLLALLSVLGGVQSLGPIGIMVGPMVVAFLQVLLTILQREIRSMDVQLET